MIHMEDIVRIDIDADGYDDMGCYYGAGLPVYQWEDPDTGETSVLRACDISDAYDRFGGV